MNRETFDRLSKLVISQPYAPFYSYKKPNVPQDGVRLPNRKSLGIVFYGSDTKITSCEFYFMEQDGVANDLGIYYEKGDSLLNLSNTVIEKRQAYNKSIISAEQLEYDKKVQNNVDIFLKYCANNGI